MAEFAALWGGGRGVANNLSIWDVCYMDTTYANFQEKISQETSGRIWQTVIAMHCKLG